MPKIFASSLADNHEQVRSSLVRALETCIRRTPYDQITLADVAAEAGIARNTIYNYAKDKAALTADAADFAGRSLLKQVHAIAADKRPATERLAATVKAIVYWVAESEYPAITRHAIISATPVNPRGTFALQHTLIEQIEGIIDEGIREGAFRSDLAMTMMLLPGVMHLAVATVFARPHDKKHVANEAIRMILVVLKP